MRQAFWRINRKWAEDHVIAPCTRERVRHQRHAQSACDQACDGLNLLRLLDDPRRKAGQSAKRDKLVVISRPLRACGCDEGLIGERLQRD